MLDPVLTDLSRYMRDQGELDAAESGADDHAEDVAAELRRDAKAFAEAVFRAGDLPFELTEQAAWHLAAGDRVAMEAKLRQFFDAVCAAEAARRPISRDEYDPRERDDE